MSSPFATKKVNVARKDQYSGIPEHFTLSSRQMRQRLKTLKKKFDAGDIRNQAELKELVIRKAAGAI